MSNETLTLTGIVLSVLVGIITLYLTIKNNKQNTFINSVTASRIQYIQDLRISISNFCGLVYSYTLKTGSLKDEKIYELHKEADQLKYLIRLYLNPQDDFWDSKMIGLIDEIMKVQPSDSNNLQIKIDELITLTQYLLKLEWEGAKLESEKGILSATEKRELYNKYIELYNNRI